MVADTRAEQADVAALVFQAVQAAVANYPAIHGCEYEHAPTDVAALPCLTMTTIEGAPVDKHYLDGGSVANYRFALQLRSQATESQGRLDARALLEQIASDLTGASINLGTERVFWSLSSDTLPCRTGAGEAFADWRTELTLKYQSH